MLVVLNVHIEHALTFFVYNDFVAMSFVAFAISCLRFDFFTVFTVKFMDNALLLMLSARVFHEIPAVAYLLKTYLVKACLINACLLRACLLRVCLDLFLFELRVYRPVSVHPTYFVVFRSKYFILR